MKFAALLEKEENSRAALYCVAPQSVIPVKDNAWRVNNEGLVETIEEFSYTHKLSCISGMSEVNVGWMIFLGGWLLVQASINRQPYY